MGELFESQYAEKLKISQHCKALVVKEFVLHLETVNNVEEIIKQE